MIPAENIQKTFYRGGQAINWKVSKYTLIANLYFFYNALLLPKGLLYTNILSPVFFYNQLLHRRKTYWQHFLVFLLAYDAIHLAVGVDILSFIISNGYFISCYFCVISFYHFFNNYDHLGRLFRQLVLINFCFALIAIPFFFMEPKYLDWFWWVNREAMGRNEFPRLKLFTYEASYYSLLMVPVFFYYVLKYLFGQIRHSRNVTIIMVLLPVILSMSLGVIGASLLTAVIMACIFWKRLLVYRRPFIITVSIVLLLVLSFFALWLFLPESPLLARIFAIFQGTDTSANGRTSDSYSIGWRVAEAKSVWFGSGLGQIKIQITELVKTYYRYWGNYKRYDIPNVMGETIAIFGIVGVALRIGLEWFLFFRTRTYSNYYRLSLFIFVFIYQFTGSFITNIVEYVIWILAFSQVFEQFNTRPAKS